jgi:2,3,4,5-tetrahydropyridine-2,6-dicarboxylate N-succinyltransferase
MSSKTVQEIIQDLDQGRRCVVFQKDAKWQVDVEAKQAILDFFKLQKMEPVTQDPPFFYVDKIPVKTSYPNNVRVVPPAVVRYGSYIESGVVLMPSYVNIGATVREGSMIDNFALVGSCAYIGKHCHISAHVTIGGVLEPPQAQPVIIEDNCFVGAGARIVEGVLVESGAIIGAGVTLTASTRIVDVRGSKQEVYKGRVPANAVVVPGSIPKDFPAGTFDVQCALIIGERSASHNTKLSLNETLRKYNDFAF